MNCDKFFEKRKFLIAEDSEKKFKFETFGLDVFWKVKDFDVDLSVDTP